ncbi:MAG: hypothetical protein ACFFCV_07235 [Promethearchaeota archaeon]
MSILLSFSTSPLTRIIDAKYYDFESTLKVMRKLWDFSVIQGYELQHLAEWQANSAPLDNDPRYDRHSAWKESIKYSVDEIGEKVNNLGISILSVHGNRDIGILCCSDKSEDINNARRIIQEGIEIAIQVKARICVFHMWDTFNIKFNPSIQKEIINEMSEKYSNIKLSVENIPTKIPEHTPYDLIKDFKWITLDIRWAVLYDELKRFYKVKDKIVNIHLRGILKGKRWILERSSYSFYEVLDMIINEWNYNGLLTIEPEGGLIRASWEDLIEAISSINKVISGSIKL